MNKVTASINDYSTIWSWSRMCGVSRLLVQFTHFLCVPVESEEAFTIPPSSTALPSVVHVEPSTMHGREAFSARVHDEEGVRPQASQACCERNYCNSSFRKRNVQSSQCVQPTSQRDDVTTPPVSHLHVFVRMLDRVSLQPFD